MKRWLVVVVLMLAVCFGTFGWYRFGAPVLSESDVDDARASILAARDELPESCDRAPLGDAAESTITVLDLVDLGGPINSCARFRRSVNPRSALTGRFRPRNAPEDEWAYRGAPSLLGGERRRVRYVPVPGFPLHAPPYRTDEVPPVLSQLASRCARLPAFVDTIARAPGRCSPYHWNADERIRVAAPEDLAEALAAIARAGVAEGDALGALRLAVQGHAVTGDFRAGNVTALSAVATAPGHAILRSLVEWIVANASVSDTAALRRMSEQMHRLRDRGSIYTHLVLDIAESVARVERTATDVETASESIWDLGFSLDIVREACEGATVFACHRDLKASLTTVPELERWTQKLLGPRMLRGPNTVIRIRADLQNHVLDMVQTLLLVELCLQQTAALLHLAAERSEGRCPPRAVSWSDTASNSSRSSTEAWHQKDLMPLESSRNALLVEPAIERHSAGIEGTSSATLVAFALCEGELHARAWQRDPHC